MTATPRISSFIIGAIVVGLAATPSLPASLDAWRTDTNPGVSRSVAVPEPSARSAIDDPAREEGFEANEPTPSQPARCEADMNRMVDPTLVRLVGRCFA
jgi:hypothetical protein